VSSDTLRCLIWKKYTVLSEDPAVSNIRVGVLIVEKLTKAVSYLTLPDDVSSQFLMIFEYVEINGEASNTLF
jgi:hypothetical protein